jgi:hypothetical protein
MSGPHRRRAAIVALLVLLLVTPLLALAPAAPGAVRVAGVSLLWWYAGLVAPVLATGIAVVVLLRERG